MRRYENRSITVHISTTGRALLDDVRAYAERFDPRLLDAAQATEAVEVWTKIRNIAAVLVGLAAVRVDQTGAWQGTGCHDGADWLARRSGTSRSRARERLKTAGRLEGLDATTEAAKRGDLSDQLLDAISDAATADPDKEQQLLDASKVESVGELQDRAAKIKANADPDPDATRRRIHANRRVRGWSDPDGTEHRHVSGPRDQIAKFDAALRPGTEARFKEARAAGEHESEEVYRFDALIALLERDTSDDPAATRRRTRHRALVRVDLEALVRGSTDDGETCDIAGLGPVPVSTAREMLGDSTLYLVLTKGTDVANVTYLGRGPSAAQKIALLWHMPQCSRLGCPNRAHLENDHRVDWRFCHQTVLGELDPLCGHDHDLKTHRAWALVVGTGRRPMVPPDHPDHPNNARREPAMTGAPPP